MSTMQGSTPSSATKMTAAAEDTVGREQPGREPSALEAQLRRYAKPLVVLAIAVADGVVIWRFGVAPGILLLAAMAMLLVVTLLFRAVQNATGELDEEDELDLARAPTAAEEQKRAAIQALKDLEYEKSVGKISPEDYEALVARYRGEAKRLMREVDEERKAMRAKAEELAAAAVREALADEPAAESGREATKDEEPTKPATPTAKPESKRPAAKATVRCAECDTNNDEDARFCKKCGAKLGPAEAASTKEEA